jgi:hypothetical protein
MTPAESLWRSNVRTIVVHTVECDRRSMICGSGSADIAAILSASISAAANSHDHG